MFSLQPSARSHADVAELVRVLETITLRIDGQAQDDIQTAVTDGFARNFEREGGPHGAWAQLSPMTQRDRSMKGFPPAHPILQRTGDYRAALTNPHHPDHYHQVRYSGHVFVQEEGSNHRHLDLLEGGGGRVPARPATELDGQAEAQLGVTLDRVLDRLFTRAGY